MEVEDHGGLAMSCCEMHETLGAYLDGELSAGEREAFRKHLESCSDCRRELAEQERLWAFLGSFEEAEVSIGLTRRILEGTVGPRRKAGRTRPLRWAVPVAAAAAVLVAAGVWYHFRPPDVLDAKTVAVIEKLEVLENLDILEDLDLLQAAVANPAILKDPDAVNVVLEGESS